MLFQHTALGLAISLITYFYACGSSPQPSGSSSDPNAKGCCCAGLPPNRHCWIEQQNLCDPIGDWTPGGCGGSSRLQNRHPLDDFEAKLILAKLDQSSDQSCLKKCSGGSNPDCSVVVLDSVANKGIAELYSRLVGNSNVISAKDLKKMFAVTDDPCQRGETRIDHELLTNDGKLCRFQTESQAIHLLLRVEVPEHLKGKLTKTDALRIDFNKTDVAPNLDFVDSRSVGPSKQLKPHYLQADFGGAALWAEADDNFVFVRTVGGCVGAARKKK